MQFTISIFDKLVSFNDNKPKLRVSFGTLAEVMGVPEAAIYSIAKSNKIAVQSECIDENSLSVFEDSYIRKLRFYFKRMMRNASEMGYSDIRAFIDFCQTFKKPNIKYKKICCWDDIDENSIRKQFQEDVKRESDFIDEHENAFSILSGIGSIGIKLYAPEKSDWELFVEHSRAIQERSEVLNKVTHSLYYLRKDTDIQLITKSESDTQPFIVSAHYYIYCRDDKDDHHEDTNENMKYNFVSQGWSTDSIFEVHNKKRCYDTNII